MTYAGFWKRFFALLIDGIIVWLLSLVLIVPYFVPPLTIIIAGIYHIVFLTSPLRATPGKALMKISVVKSNGSLLTIKDAVIRFAVSFVSSLVLCIGYIISLFTERRQTFHDIIADTVVIEEVFAEQKFIDIFINQAKLIFNNAQTGSAQAAASTTPIDANYQKPASTQSLEDLYNLYQKGILTEAEYNMKKEEFLKRL
ncbi:MAG: RDD family protein [Bdellovibrionales bacterium]|nr:RDD family protein [Bdellovibrionales bacterium]